MTALTRLSAALLKLPPASTTDVVVERDLVATMPDAAELVADRWYPAATADRTATLLIRTPYGRRIMGPLGRIFAERGYQTVIQSCRGTFGSEGEWDPFRHEQSDGQATLRWISVQPWFDGRLVMWGASYLGITQWAVAEDPPDFLEALSLQVTAANVRDAIVYPGGSFALETALSWLYQLKHQELGWKTVLRTQVRGAKVLSHAADVLPLAKADVAAVGEPVRAYRDWLEHDAPGDPWWDAVDFARRPSRVPPASFVGGWYDLFLPAQIADYEALRRAGRTARLTVGPWSHSSPGLVGESIRDGLSWFDAQLGDRPGPEARGPVRVHVMGSDRWEEFSLWPPASETQRWYLGRSGTLATEPPSEGGPDRFHYNPNDPTPAVGGASLNARAARDQRINAAAKSVTTC